jgi:hypothetical protein
MMHHCEDDLDVRRVTRGGLPFLRIFLVEAVQIYLVGGIVVSARIWRALRLHVGRRSIAVVLLRVEEVYDATNGVQLIIRQVDESLICLLSFVNECVYDYGKATMMLDS